MELIFWICIALLFYTYFGYLGVLLLITKLPAFRKRPAVEEHANWPTVDVLVAAYNEELVIGKKIENCLNADYPEGLLQVWIVSDGSTDDTDVIARRYEKEHKNVHVLVFPRAGKANAINTAVPCLNSDLIVFSDANVEFPPQAVKNMIEHFTDESVGCVCGKLVYRNPKGIISGKGESFYWKYETLLKRLESRIGYVSGANGAIYAIRTSLVEKLPKGTINDDFVTSMRAVKKGFKCLYEEKAAAYEEVAPSAESEFKRHVRDGAGHYLAIVHLAGLLNPFLGLRSFIYWSHRIIRWMGPFFILTVLVANIFLLGKAKYNAIFILQVAVYMLAVVGFLVQGKKKLPFFVYVPFYFMSLNVALFLGFVKAITGTQKMSWESTRRG